MADADRQKARIAARLGRRETSGTRRGRALRTRIFETTPVPSIILFLFIYIEECLSEAGAAPPFHGLPHYTPKCCA